jgi:hypothetical protein
MNIFFLDWNPHQAAKYHCDKHVVKMILECAQLLYSAHWVLTPSRVPESAYKKTHINHPCSIWVRESIENYEWLCELAIALCSEYTYRYGKIHKTQKHIEWLIRNPPFDIPPVHKTPVRLAMPDEYKIEDPIESYRLFYRESKMKQRGIVNYTKRDWPEFLSVK